MTTTTIMMLLTLLSADDEVNITDTFPLNSLLPANTADYYQYNGSLTTPSCYQSVNWTVFKEPINISQSQVIGIKLTDALVYITPFCYPTSFTTLQ